MLVLAAASARITAPACAHAQIRASERASVSQVVDGTRLTVDYARPRTRGRMPVFGTQMVRWGEVWTPGANDATTLEVSRDVRLAGHPVPRGKYSVWMVVRQDGNWTFVLDPRAGLFHEAHPDSTSAQLRFAVRPDSAPLTDMLTWSFDSVRASGATLTMQWATTRVTIPVEITPSLSLTMPAAEAAPYVGTYAFREVVPAGFKAFPTFVVSYADSTLRGEWVPAHPYLKRFALLRIAPDWFTPGLYDDKGQIFEVLRPDVVIQFRRAGGQPTSFEVRNKADSLVAVGTRKR